MRKNRHKIIKSTCIGVAWQRPWTQQHKRGYQKTLNVCIHKRQCGILYINISLINPLLHSLNIFLLIFTKFESSLFQILTYNDDTASHVKVQYQNRNTPQFNMLPVTNVFVRKYEKLLPSPRRRSVIWYESCKYSYMFLRTIKESRLFMYILNTSYFFVSNHGKQETW